MIKAFLVTASAVVLLGMCMTASAADENRAYVGKVVKISKTELQLDQGRGLLMIGFVGDAEQLRTLEEIKIGDEVRAVFGDTRRTPTGPPINKFLSIRVCRKIDNECAVDRKRGQDESLAQEKESDLISQRHALCKKEMDEVLAKDSRFIPSTSNSSQNDMVRFNALAGEQRVCAAAVLRQHQDAYFEACKNLHCFDNVGGGCYHMANKALNYSVFQTALEKCGTLSD